MSLFIMGLLHSALRSHPGAQQGIGNFIPWSKRRRGRRWSFGLGIPVFEEMEWRVAAEGIGETKGIPAQIVTFTFIVLSYQYYQYYQY